MGLTAMGLFDDPITFIPKNWVRYVDASNDFYYNPKEYEVLHEEDGSVFCHYVANCEVPSQPIGLRTYHQLFATYRGKILDLSRWDFKLVEDMSCMFKYARLLRKVIFSLSDYSNVRSIDELFYCCISLQQVEWRNINFSSLQLARNTWCNCTNLKILNLAGWCVPELKDMSDFCRGCSSLEELYLTGWDYRKGVRTTGAFFGCDKLRR